MFHFHYRLHKFLSSDKLFLVRVLFFMEHKKSVKVVLLTFGVNVCAD